MFSTVVFAFSLVGLATLFSFKVVELTRDARTPLHSIRRIGDPLVRTGWVAFSQALRRFLVSVIKTSTIWAKATVHTSHHFFDAGMHAMASRLNRYLRGRRTQTRQGLDISAHLKSVLQKEKDDSGRPDEK